MRLESTAEGLHLPEVGLHLDPLAPVPAAVLTHGHSDHARALSREIFCTEPTAAVARVRLGETTYHARGYGEPFEVQRPGCAPARLTLFPAGHVLGSAAVLVEALGTSLLYTGDVKLHPSLTCAPADLPKADQLVIEATFGLPIYRFPDVETLRGAIVEEARAALAAGEVPVFLGYALGKGPEITCILSRAGVPVSAHGAVWNMLEIYRSFGVEFGDGDIVAYEKGGVAGRALVVPPSCRTHPMIASIKSKRVVAVTGWALLDASYDRYGADALIPLSDHADWDELLAIVEATGAREVVTTHGYAEPFARVLRERGVASRALGILREEDE